ncbi:hypothetical protein [Methylocystis sp.]|uniref:hypothetical protein n=1 Tax=Methylocystis sp. TaxID=1911079 RepID=UPI003DA3EF64
MADDTDSADRPALKPSEIEVTPEMIEAGREVIASRWMEFIGLGGSSEWAEVLRLVFLAMMEVRPKSRA